MDLHIIQLIPHTGDRLIMRTFNYPVPASFYVKNGGNIMDKVILTTPDITGANHHIKNRIGGDGSILNLINKENPENETKVHIDMCWVIAEVNL